MIIGALLWFVFVGLAILLILEWITDNIKTKSKIPEYQRRDWNKFDKDND